MGTHRQTEVGDKRSGRARWRWARARRSTRWSRATVVNSIAALRS